MKKRIMLILLLVVVLFPITVRANIVCNDGTTSPSCADCHQGCCSHHGGCATYSSDSNYRSNTTIRKQTVAPYTINEEKDESSLNSVEDDATNIEDKTIDKYKIENNTIDEENDSSDYKSNDSKTDNSSDSDNWPARIIFIASCIIGIKLYKGNKKDR